MELTDIRVEIDQIDNELKELFKRRMGLASEIAKIKAKTGDAIYKPDREAEIIKRLSEDVDDDYKDGYIDWISHMLMASRNYQEKLINR